MHTASMNNITRLNKSFQRKRYEWDHQEAHAITKLCSSLHSSEQSNLWPTSTKFT